MDTNVVKGGVDLREFDQWSGHASTNFLCLAVQGYRMVLSAEETRGSNFVPKGLLVYYYLQHNHSHISFFPCQKRCGCLDSLF